jgi:hypothetical protein
MVNQIKVEEVKSNVVPCILCRDKREEELLLTIDLGTRWGEWSASRPGRSLARGKDPIGQEAG